MENYQNKGSTQFADDQIENFKKLSDLLTSQNLALKNEIEERKLAQVALSLSQENLSITLNSIGDAVIATDELGRVVYFNPVAEKLCGWVISEAKGKHLNEVFNIINAKTREAVTNPVEKVLSCGHIIGLANHTVLISQNGKEYQIADSAAPIINNEGLINGVVMVFSDVTEKYANEEALRASDESYRMLFDSINDAVFISEMTEDGKISKFLRVNNVACERLGYTEEELLNKYSYEINSESARATLAPKMKNILERKHALVETEHQAKDGRIIPVEISTKLTQHGNKYIFHSIARDITERRLKEEQLHDAENRYRILFNNMLEGYAYCQMVFDDGIGVDWKYILVNDAFTNLTGLKNVEGRLISELIPGLREDDKELFDIYSRVAITGVSEKFENYVPTLDMWFLVKVYCPHKGYFVAVFDVITDRKIAETDLIEKNNNLNDLISETFKINHELQVHKVELEAQNEELHAKNIFIDTLNWELELDKHQLEKQIKELREANNDLMRFNRATEGRELKMIELKQEINNLLQQMGKPEKYKIVE